MAAQKYLMNLHTGSVDTEEQWMEDWRSTSEEMWGRQEFNDGSLIEVKQNSDGQWVEV